MKGVIKACQTDLFINNATSAIKECSIKKIINIKGEAKISSKLLATISNRRLAMRPQPIRQVWWTAIMGWPANRSTSMFPTNRLLLPGIKR